MENKINIAELLKDCPKGIELDCLMYENVIFDYIEQSPESTYPIHCLTKINGGYNSLVFTHYGCYSGHPNAKCIIFPKGKTTWEGFVPPCKFKDGDVIYTDNFVAIFSNITERGSVWYHCYYCIDTEVFKAKRDFGIGNINYGEFRFATEEEKAKLFQAIKDNGYRWNAVTKTLEKLEYIEDKGNISDGYHTFNELYEYRLLYNASMFNELAKQGLYDVHKSRKHSDGAVPFGDDNWFIVQAELPTGQISNHYEMKDWELFKVPEKEKANQYDGHTPQDVAKRLRDFLTLEKLVEPKFKVGDTIQNEDGYKVKITEVNLEDECYGYESMIAKGIGGIFFSEQNNWELVPNKFDITTLVPFERVLVRICDTAKWFGDFYLWYDDTEKDFPYNCVGGTWSQCIPFEGNQHLLGSTNDCDEFFKTWE